ncbi:MFS transporter [Weissella diestrammenae]|uniref:MFS transporter n=1 Tax=Weissella diestrammenae TaxID=1162633 RepID=A0A7G9T4U4_9LACO|nr:MFS transporter [Weissella diestrammenae]MCM0582832.1 MFS transporter [Weissella diestrammenae]QNN75119.1 MFS transporter [Weissella diestrammenae]
MQEKTAMSFKWLLTASFINSFALGFIWPLTSIYLHDQLHQTLVVIGWVMLANALGQMIGSVISGRLFDRFAPFVLIQIGVGVMIVAQVAFIIWHSWPVYPLILVVTGLFSGWNTAAINSYGTQINNRDGRYVFNMLYFIANFGMVFATAIVGPIYAFGIIWLFVISLVMYSFLFWIIRRHFNFSIARTKADVKISLDQQLSVWNKRLIWTVIIGLGILWISYSQWLGNLSVYMSDVLSLPLWQYSMLWTINGLLIAAIQLTMNGLNLVASRRAMWIQIFGGIGFFGLAFLVLPFVNNFTGFAIAMIITTFGEATAFPMIPALINELTPNGLKGRFQGWAAAAPSAGRAFGPLLGGLMIEHSGYHQMFFAAAGIVLLALIGVAIMVMWGYRFTTHYEQ